MRMGVRRNFSRGRGECRYFAYPLQVVVHAVQIYFHQTLYPFFTTKEVPYVMATVTKMRSLAE